MIDLGEVRGELPASAAPPIVLPWRALLGVLSALLVAAAAGSARQPPPRPPTILPARLADLTVIDADRLFVVSGGRRPALVSAYRLPGGQLLSRTAVALAGPVSGVVQAGGTIVVSYQRDASGGQATVALPAGQDRVLWRLPYGLVSVSAPAGVALLSSGTGGFSAVDLATGAVRWSARQPADGYLVVGGPSYEYPRWLLTVWPDGRLKNQDATTGRVLATRRGPPLAADTSTVAWTAGTLALVGGPTLGVTAYRLPGLTPLWTTTADLSRTWLPGGCGPVLCAFRQQQGIVVLDPATGRLLWGSGRWGYAEAVGGYLVAAPFDRGPADPSYWVLDPRTGRVLGDLGTWDLPPSDSASGPLYGTHSVPGQDTIAYGVLDPGKRTVSVLGSGKRVSGDCRTGGGALVCRLVDASIAIWRLR